MTDGKGAKTTLDPKLQLFPDQPQPSQIVSIVSPDKNETVDIFGPGGRLLYDADIDVDSATALITGHGPKVPFTAFVDSGQTISNFHPGGPAHDSLDLSHSTLSGMSDLLHHTSMFQGSATIHVDPLTTITLTGVTKGQIAHNPTDFTFAQPE